MASAPMHNSVVMENSDAMAVRHVRCPKCHSVLEEPRARVYQCGGCGTSLRAKIHSGSTEEVTNIFSPSSTGLRPQSRHYRRPILKGTPFIVCSRCIQLVQVPKLRCESCYAVLSYSKDSVRKKLYQDSIDQLSIDSPELQVDAALVFEVPEESGAPVYQVSGRSTTVRYRRCHSELDAQVYQDSGCGTNLRVKTRTGSTGEVANASSPRSGLPPQSRHYCQPILKGAPFIVFCSCFKLLQVPIDFVVSTNAVGKLRCGSCSSVLSYSDRALARKKPYQDSVDQLSTNSSKLQVEEPHYTPYTDAMAWLAMGKQRRKGLNHRLMQQAGHKLHGRDEIRQNIMEKILLDRNDGSNCTVFCINGGSGFGKTSLLNVLYNDQELLYAFDKMIWIQMSDKLDILMLFRKIIEFVMNDHCSIMSTDLLQELLMEEITDEKFLLILDDADIEDQQFWNSILEVLNAGARGSVVIMATKSCAVATPRDLCHDALPVHLKRCLAFCSLFPEGYIFDKHHMVLLWISHGCVRPVEGREPEDVGTEYFNELLCRSFFQYSPSHDYKDNKFVMHELIYNVVASVSRDKYFKSEDPMCGIPENVLHCSLISSQFQTVELMHRTEQLKDLQTFLALLPEWKLNSISLPTLNLVGLDILDLSHTETKEFPGSIAGLRNLRYLSVNNTNVRALPSELCSLSNLQTLEAKHCRFLTELPRDMRKLVKLRHLDLTKQLGYIHMPHGIGDLTELQTLPVFHVSGDSSHCSISELGSLQYLRGCLWLSGLGSVKTSSKAQEANLKDKHHLNDLTLQWHGDGMHIEDEGEDEDKDTEDVADEQFPAIAHLPSLESLSMRKMYDVQRLSSNRDTHGAAKFPSLELLNMWEMYGLEELFEEESEGDCPRLRKICISRCPDLKRLPRARSMTELVLHCGQQLPDISELASLVSLKIEGFHGVRSFGLPPAAAALKRLEIRSCKELASVDGLSAALTTVQKLKIAGCPKLVLPGASSSLQTT
ncbi:unnamed protein product [Miscanthus lutarioriparius]|uniref:Uncharacterized protein n=1 Tax=Miscanthus lutarioriparius TaxID=422564 RepID=A0A811QZV6_9POAL|nr:unnamed protein product [Miscanthus lutarioriparius]